MGPVASIEAASLAARFPVFGVGVPGAFFLVTRKGTEGAEGILACIHGAF